MNLKKLLLAGIVAVMAVSCDKYTDLPDGIYASVKTDKGTELLLRLDYENTPMTVGNFVALAEGTMKGELDTAFAGKKYYDGLVFHRVIRGFMIQGGDPTGTGAGGPGYEFPNETSDSIKHRPGVIAMANAGPDTNGSQFYITEAETPWLDGNYTVFGCLVNPEDVSKVSTVEQGDRIKEVKIIRRGEKAADWDAYKAFSENKPLVEARNKAIAEEKAAAVKAAVDAKFADATVTESGLKVLVTEKGKGRRYKAGEQATVHYTGTLEDGTIFDSSVAHGKPFTFTLGRGEVIKGWDEAVAMLPIGTKATVYLPSDLAYGQRGAAGVIPPGANLIFDIEILEPQK